MLRISNFVPWMRFLPSCKFAQISFLPRRGSLDAVGTLCSSPSPSVINPHPAIPLSPACCTVNLLHRGPSFRFQWFIEGDTWHKRGTPISTLVVKLHQVAIFGVVSFLTSSGYQLEACVWAMGKKVPSDGITPKENEDMMT
jgi:hypothetical protein